MHAGELVGGEGGKHFKALLGVRPEILNKKRGGPPWQISLEQVPKNKHPHSFQISFNPQGMIF